MNLPRKLLVGATLASLLLGGCTSKVTEKEQYSGFLSNYNNLQWGLGICNPPSLLL